MKYLENSSLEALSSTISIGAIDCILDIKLEAYSCKMIQSDKKQWKSYEDGNGLSERQCVMNAVDGKFSATVNNYTTIRDELWVAIESEIQPSDCRIYSFKSSYAGDPFSEDGCLWCLNFFFYNKNLKRLFLFSCRALSQNGGNLPTDQLWDLEDE
uniref:Repressor of RNA polymerase III transcription MAF1 homolog n=1 Tax=Heterorhabditis bacteriophora TaxID=37862 RepID=A0A1I7WYD5_HETBA